MVTLEVHPRKHNTTQQQPSEQAFVLRLFQTALAYFFVFFDANQSIPEPSLTGSLTLEVERKPFSNKKILVQNTDILHKETASKYFWGCNFLEVLAIFFSIFASAPWAFGFNASQPTAGGTEVIVSTWLP